MSKVKRQSGGGWRRVAAWFTSRDAITNTVGVFGVLMLGGGVALISVPWALITLGSLFLALSIWSALR